MKIVINKCFGGYGFSVKAVKWLEAHGFEGEGFSTPIAKYYGALSDRAESALREWREAVKTGDYSDSFMTVFSNDESCVLSTRPKPRMHPLLIQCVEELGESADGDCADLSIVEIPDGIEYEIDEYDGMESVHEKHRVWY